MDEIFKERIGASRETSLGCIRARKTIAVPWLVKETFRKLGRVWKIHERLSKFGPNFELSFVLRYLGEGDRSKFYGIDLLDDHTGRVNQRSVKDWHAAHFLSF